MPTCFYVCSVFIGKFFKYMVPFGPKKYLLVCFGIVVGITVLSAVTKPFILSKNWQIPYATSCYSIV